MDWKLEVVVVPVTDVDRAKRFYADQVGFVVDGDTRVGDEMRMVQLTPPGSACSIVVGTGLVDMPPGSVKGLQLVVSNVEAARAELVERGVQVSGKTEMTVTEYSYTSDQAHDLSKAGLEQCLDKMAASLARAA
jgi:predicted enzyme related to lactoylglutathione lyase